MPRQRGLSVRVAFHSFRTNQNCLCPTPSYVCGKIAPCSAPSRHSETSTARSVVTPLENFLWKCSMGYTLYPWISLLEPTLETSYKPQT